MTVITIKDERNGIAEVETDFYRFNRDLCAAENNKGINDGKTIINFLKSIIEFYDIAPR